jgi:tetratricopeptide (TPR) repeat protein
MCADHKSAIDCGGGRGARAMWVRHPRIAAIAIAAVLSLLAITPSEARWLRAESPQFIVYSQGSEADVRAVAQELQDFDALLRLMTGFTGEHAANKLTVYLVNSKDELKTIDPHVAPQVLGFYRATNEGIMVAVLGRDWRGPEWASARNLIFHEYTHHFYNQYVGEHYPSWFEEGIAEYDSTAEFKGDKVRLGGFTQMRAWELFATNWVPAEQLFDPAPDAKQPEGFYSHSWMTVHYLMESQERAEQAQRYLNAVMRGEDHAKAFQGAFGMDYAAFDKALKGYVSRAKIVESVISRPPEAKPVDIKVVALPRSADAMLLHHARMMGNFVGKDGRDAFLAKVRSEAAAFPDDPLALHTLGMAEAEYGDQDKADAPLDRALALNRDDVEALYLKMMRYYEAARRHPDARKQFEQQAKKFGAEVYKREPNNYPTLYFYACMAMDDSEVPTENTLNTILLAHELAPQVDEITITAGIAALRAHHLDDARHLLERVAYTPHPSGAAAVARKYLDQIAGNGAADGAPKGSAESANTNAKK